MTPERQAELEASRQRAQVTDQQRAIQGAVVDGIAQIEAALTKPVLTSLSNQEPEMMLAGAKKGKAAAAKGKRVSVRR